MKWISEDRRKSKGQGVVKTTEGKFGANDRIPRGREIESWLIALERQLL